MQTALIAVVLVFGVQAGEPSLGNKAMAGEPLAAPQQFYAEAPRPYAPSITVYYPSPSYDCYSHGHRGIECYPAFCERHYRRPYNYRVKFDYPWHEDVYRNWPDACMTDEEPYLPIAEAARVYTGPRRNSAVAQRPLTSREKPPTAMLRDAPTPR